MIVLKFIRTPPEVSIGTVFEDVLLIEYSPDQSLLIYVQLIIEFLKVLVSRDKDLFEYVLWVGDFGARCRSGPGRSIVHAHSISVDACTVAGYRYTVSHFTSISELL